MRILSIISDAFGGHGGIALYNRDLLRAFGSFGLTREVVAFPRVMRFAPEALPRNVKVITAGVNNRFLYTFHLLQRLRSDRDFQIIHCGHIKLLPLALLVRCLLHKPILLAIYGIDAWDRDILRLPLFMLQKVQMTLSISEVTATRFLDWSGFPRSRMRLLPNAIHLDRYGIGPKSPELTLRYGLQGKQVLMTMGRLVSSERYKGFDEVLELMPKLAAEFPDLQYLVVGEGSDLTRLKEKAEHLGIRDRVVFTGLIPEKEKADHYRLADLYVMPSRGEGFGYVLLEAMACGIPVVASILDGTREAVRNGLLGPMVDPRRPEELETAIRNGLQQTTRSIQPGLQYFSFPQFERRCHRLLGELSERSD